MSVLWEVDLDSREVVEHLHEMRDDQRLAPIFAVVAEDLVAAVIDRIDSQGDGEWPDNALSTIERKGGSKPMVDSAQLYGSIRGESGPDWAMASTSVAYIVYHLDGGPVIPQRNPFMVRDEVFEEAAAMIAQAGAMA